MILNPVQTNEEAGTIAGRWNKLDSERTTHLERCRLCAALTLPWVLPPVGSTYNTELPEPAQSHGARCVSNLASKLWLTLFPPNQSFMKLDLSAQAKAELEGGDEPQATKALIDAGFAKIEDAVMTHITTTNIRSAAFRALVHYVVTGNVLVYFPPPGKDVHPWRSRGSGLKVFRLDQYVVVRDPLGNLLEIIVKEEVSIAALPEDIAAQVKAQSNTASEHPEVNVPLYTRVVLEDGVYHVEQEAGTVPISEAKGTYNPDMLPWLALRWTEEDVYGHGPVESNLGDMKSCERLSDALERAALAASRVIPMVNPNGVTMIEDLNDAEDGDFIPGVADDVSFVQMEKYHDLKVAADRLEKVEQRLAFVFLLNSAVQRQAERVTAEEIKYLAQELEDALGGQYSIMSKDFQLPTVRLVLQALMETGKIPDLDKDNIYPVITTGMEALGRTHEQTRLTGWVDDLISKFGPEQVAMMIDTLEYAKRSAVNFGVPSDGLLKSSDQIQAETQQNQQMSLLQQATPQLAKGMADYVNNGNAQQGQVQ